MSDAILSYRDISHGNTGPQAKGVDTSVYTTYILPNLKLGMVAWGEDGKKYRYVRFRDAVTYAAGHVVTPAAADGFEVTNDRSGGSAIAGLEPVGVALGAPSQNDYGWIQVGGIAEVLAGAGITAGDQLKPDASTDGAADVATAGTDQNVLGVALEDISDTEKGAVLLRER